MDAPAASGPSGATAPAATSSATSCSTLRRMEQFHRFFTALSVRPLSTAAMSAHRAPNLAYSRMMMPARGRVGGRARWGRGRGRGRRAVLVLGPRRLANVGVQLVVPSLAALLARPAGQVRREHAPLPRPVGLDGLEEQRVLLRAPRALDDRLLRAPVVGAHGRRCATACDARVGARCLWVAEGIRGACGAPTIANAGARDGTTSEQPRATPRFGPQYNVQWWWPPGFGTDLILRLDKPFETTSSLGLRGARRRVT